MIFRYQLWKDGESVTTLGPNAPSLTISNVTDLELGVYKLLIDNGQGTSIIPVELAQGGTPYTWESGAWSTLYGAVRDEEKSLIFASSYNQNIPIKDEEVL